MLMENIALRHQLMVYERGRTARRSLSGNDRLLWCFLARFFSNWRDNARHRPTCDRHPLAAGALVAAPARRAETQARATPASTPSYRL